MSRIQRGFGKALLGAALALSVALPLTAGERRVDILYNFTGGADGAVPSAGLVRDAAGNFYGAAGGGGGACGCGVVFKLSPQGVETTLHTFAGGSGGRRPNGALVADAAGNLYGTTKLGGAHDFGVVFKLTPGGAETVLHAFAGGSDGERPRAGLAMDGAGNLYGATFAGGASDLGTVFKLAPDGTETVLHAFTGGADGTNPNGGLIVDEKGALYGATFSDQGGHGAIFKIAAGGHFSVLHSFTGGADGTRPHGGVIMDPQGNLYGTTLFGGAKGCASGCGVVFKLAPDGALTVLHSFTGAPDARSPEDSLVMDGQGNLFSATEDGGNFNRGAVFEISPDGTEAVVHSFAGSPGGKHPQGSLLLYMNKLNGVTAAGGTAGGCQAGCGTVFEVRKAK